MVKQSLRPSLSRSTSYGFLAPRTATSIYSLRNVNIRYCRGLGLNYVITDRAASKLASVVIALSTLSPSSLLTASSTLRFREFESLELKLLLFEVQEFEILLQSKVTSHEKLKSHGKLTLMTFDESRSWEKEQSVSPLLRTPPLKKTRIGIAFQGKNLYAYFFHTDCVDDHFDVLDNWSYEDVYSGGCFDVSGSFKGFDCIKELVGCDDGSHPVKIKDEFKNEVILDDVVSSPANFSMLLKRKGKSRVKFTRMRGIIKSIPKSFCIICCQVLNDASPKIQFLSRGGLLASTTLGTDTTFNSTSLSVGLPLKTLPSSSEQGRSEVTLESYQLTFDCTMTQTTSMKIDSNADVAFKEVILGTDDETSSKDDTSSNDKISLNEFPTGNEMFLEIDEVIFKIHTKGYFKYDPLRMVP
nr:hypothetical protein [Tanacetum cinerariifolium]